MLGFYTLYTFDLGPCEYIAYFFKRKEGKKGKKEERREKKWREERRGNERRRGEQRKEGQKGRKKGKKEKEGKEEEREHPSCSFALGFFPWSHTAASATMTPEVAAPCV